MIFPPVPLEAAVADDEMLGTDEVAAALDAVTNVVVCVDL